STFIHTRHSKKEVSRNVLHLPYPSTIRTMDPKKKKNITMIAFTIGIIGIATIVYTLQYDLEEYCDSIWGENNSLVKCESTLCDCQPMNCSISTKQSQNACYKHLNKGADVKNEIDVITTIFITTNRVSQSQLI